MGSRILLVGTYRPIGTYLAPRENSAGTNPWGPENKHIMAEVKKNSELLDQVLREIQGLKDLLMVILDNTRAPPPPSSSPKDNTRPTHGYIGMGTPLGFRQA